VTCFYSYILPFTPIHSQRRAPIATTSGSSFSMPRRARVRRTRVNPSWVVLFLSCRVSCCCGVVLVVSCVVLFLLCLCVCGLFLFDILPSLTSSHSHPSIHRVMRQSLQRAAQVSSRGGPFTCSNSHPSIHRRFIIQRGHEHTRTGN